MLLLTPEFKPFIARSAALHGGLLFLAAAAGLRAPSMAREEVYRIDFLGPTGGILNRDREAGGGMKAATAPAHPSMLPPQTDPDSFSRRGSPLPKPSLLGGRQAPETTAPVPPARAGQAAAPGSGGGGSASVSADMPDFPYPWYLSRLRGSLWDRWLERRAGATNGQCTISFSLLRDGALTDLRVASTSGDETFDYAAQSAVQAAAPFPPLPDGFKDSFLKVRVEFRAD